MRYELLWQSNAFNHMSAIVRAAPDRKDEFAVLRELSASLATDPEGTGESREPPYRVAIVGEMTFYFRPESADGRVYVTWVRIWKARH